MKLVLDNGKEVELSQELASQLEEVVKQSEVKRNGWERVKKGLTYYLVETEGESNSQEDDNDTFDNNLYEAANYFSDEKLAEKIAFRQTLERKLMRFSAEHDGDKITIDDTDVPKPRIIYDVLNGGSLSIGFNHNVIQQGSVYFNTEEIAQLAIDTFKDDLIKYFTTMRL